MSMAKVMTKAAVVLITSGAAGSNFGQNAVYADVLFLSHARRI